MLAHENQCLSVTLETRDFTPEFLRILRDDREIRRVRNDFSERDIYFAALYIAEN